MITVYHRVTKIWRYVEGLSLMNTSSLLEHIVLISTSIKYSGTSRYDPNVLILGSNTVLVILKSGQASGIPRQLGRGIPTKKEMLWKF